MERVAKSAIEFGKGIKWVFGSAIMTIWNPDPFSVIKPMLSQEMADRLPEFTDVGRQCCFLALTLIALFIWFHRQRTAYDGQTEDALAAQKLKELRATGKAEKAYAKEVAEVPKSEADLEMGDHYENNGTVHGNMGPTNNYYGKQPFQMTDAVMQDVAAQLGSPRPLSLSWVGSQKSYADSVKLSNFLSSRGFAITQAGGIGMLIPPLSTPIELRGDTLFVDADK